MIHSYPHRPVKACYLVEVVIRPVRKAKETLLRLAPDQLHWIAAIKPDIPVDSEPNLFEMIHFNEVESHSRNKTATN